VSDERDFVLAIDVGGTKIALATADLEGRPLERGELATEAERGAAAALRRAFAAAADLVGRRGGRCLGAGVVCPGVIRPDRVDLVPTLPGWERLALHDVLREGLGLERIAVGNDVKAAAEAESRWGSLRGADPALFVSLGTGLAAALVAGGRVVTGAHGAAGEVGYSLRAGDQAGAAAGRAPLEEFAGGAGIGLRGSRLLGRPVTAAEVFALAETDPSARDLVEETLDELAVHVANWCVLLDPMRVAVGSGLMGSAGRVLEALDRRLRCAVPFPPELVPARFVRDGALRGAIALALDKVVPPPRGGGGSATTRRGVARTDSSLPRAAPLRPPGRPPPPPGGRDFLRYSSRERTAMNASWGISTAPTRFMRFLPSFCFSSSLRLRVISPP
jgi:glucokinase